MPVADGMVTDAGDAVAAEADIGERTILSQPVACRATFSNGSSLFPCREYSSYALDSYLSTVCTPASLSAAGGQLCVADLLAVHPYGGRCAGGSVCGRACSGTVFLAGGVAVRRRCGLRVSCGVALSSLLGVWLRVSTSWRGRTAGCASFLFKPARQHGYRHTHRHGRRLLRHSSQR